MARRRGPSDAERLALDIITVTATGAVLASPCFVYSLDWTVSDSSVSALFSIGDTTAAADLVKESTRIDIKCGMTVASGVTTMNSQVVFTPPVYVANQLFFANSTSIGSVSVSYLAAS